MTLDKQLLRQELRSWYRVLSPGNVHRVEMYAGKRYVQKGEFNSPLEAEDAIDGYVKEMMEAFR